MTATTIQSSKQTLTDPWPPERKRSKDPGSTKDVTGSPRLVVQTGPERGKVIELRSGPLAVGRDPKLYATLSDPRISRKHLLVYRDSAGVKIQDFSSTNGTYLNGKLISGTQKLRPGDEIRLGNRTRLTLRV